MPGPYSLYEPLFPRILNSVVYKGKGSGQIIRDCFCCEDLKGNNRSVTTPPAFIITIYWQLFIYLWCWGLSPGILYAELMLQH
jgi:hypothetical protein